MGCHGNYAFSHIPNKLIFKDGLVSILGGPNEKFGIKICPGGVHGTLNYLLGCDSTGFIIIIMFCVPKLSGPSRQGTFSFSGTTTSLRNYFSTKL